MGERLIDKCCLYFTDLDGNPIELGKFENDLSLSCDEEQIEDSKNIDINTNATLEFSSVVCSNDFTHLLEIPETHYEFAEELKEELKEISREES